MRSRCPAQATAAGWVAQDAEKQIRDLANRAADDIDKIRKADKDDPRLLFLNTQQKILEKLLKNKHFAEDAKAGIWLSKVLKVFLDSLHNALTNEKNIAGMVNGKVNVVVPPGDRLQFFQGNKAGPWWREFIKNASNAFQNRPIKQKPLSKAEFFALEMAKLHILQDLYWAILLEGAGTDEEWKIIGEAVMEAGKEVTGAPDWERVLGEWSNVIPDILEMRFKMREKVKEILPRRLRY